MNVPPKPYISNPVVPQPASGRQAPPVYRPQASAAVNAPAIIIPRGIQFKPILVPAAGMHTPKPYSVVQPKTNVASGQPKFYTNLNPAAAALKVDPAEFMRLETSFDDSYYRIRRGGDHGLLVPNTKFIFVRTMEGEVVMHQRYRHPVLAQGRPVLYAGEAYFNNGKLDWWSNGSGNYRPDADHAEQARLPMERFFSYEQVLKGTHKQSHNG
jgi:hypothetical protein